MTRLGIRCSGLAAPLLAGLLAACSGHKAAAPTASAAPLKFDPRKMTCSEFVGLSEDVRPRAVAWLDGYSRAGTLQQQDVGIVDIDRQTEVLVVACEQAPKETFWQRVRSHLPGGKKQVQPTKMTCEEFSALSETERPEVAYWLDGYNHGVQQQAVGEIDLKRDVATIVVACKPTPKESLWSKIKQHF